MKPATNTDLLDSYARLQRASSMDLVGASLDGLHLDTLRLTGAWLVR